MHKDEAAYEFSLLGNPHRVKITKFLYVNGELSFENLLNITGVDEKELEEHLKLMIEGELIVKKGNLYSANKSYIDDLMNFVRTPCGCSHH